MSSSSNPSSISSTLNTHSTHIYVVGTQTIRQRFVRELWRNGNERRLSLVIHSHQSIGAFGSAHPVLICLVGSYDTDTFMDLSQSLLSLSAATFPRCYLYVVGDANRVSCVSESSISRLLRRFPWIQAQRFVSFDELQSVIPFQLAHVNSSSASICDVSASEIE
jgi:hypothetical protein